MFSFFSNITKSIDDYSKNSKMGGWGGPATVWNPKKETEPPKKPKESNSIDNYRNNLKVGGWGGPATVWNPKMTVKTTETDIVDLTGSPHNKSHKKTKGHESDEMIADLVNN